MTEGNLLPKSLFRFFDDPQHADDFTRGKIWISTLERCRQYEDPKQGDKDEGYLTRHVDNLHIKNGDDPHVQEMLRDTPFDVRGAANIRISGLSFVQVLKDALVLCTTVRYAPETLADNFGKACVEIQNPLEVFKLISTGLLARYPMISGGYHGSIVYADREFPIQQKAPGPLGFVKPSDPYSEQQEFRMLWTVDTHNPLTPGVLEVPKIARYCRRIA